MTTRDDDGLIGLLTLFLASGKLDASQVLPALRELAEDSTSPGRVTDLIELVSARDEPVFARLAKHLTSARLAEARRFSRHRRETMKRLADAPAADVSDFELLLGDLPLDARSGWESNEPLLRSVHATLLLARDWRFINAQQAIAPATCERLNAQYAANARHGFQTAHANQDLVPLEVIRSLSGRLNVALPHVAAKLQAVADRLRSSESSGVVGGVRSVEHIVAELSVATDLAARQKLLDELCCHPSESAAKSLLQVVSEPHEQERAELILTCRFGELTLDGWNVWRNWLMRAAQNHDHELRKLRQLIEQNPGELFAFWYAGQCDSAEFDESLFSAINNWCDEHPARVDVDRFVERWSEVVAAQEWNALTGVEIDAVLTANDGCHRDR